MLHKYYYKFQRLKQLVIEIYGEQEVTETFQIKGIDKKRK